MSIDLSLCVLHYNQWDLTKDCLASIDAQEIPCTYEKVLVDNGSTKDRYHGVGNGWRIVRYEENQGHIVGQNRCFETAKAPWILFVSNDVQLRPRCIDYLWDERIDGQTMPTLLNHDHTIQSYGGRLIFNYGCNDRHRMVLPIGFDYVPSICYLLPKYVWNEVGRFDPTYPGTYEDVDFGFRLGSERLQCSLKAQAFHLGNATLQYTTNTSFHRGRIHFIKKHYRGVIRLVSLATVKFLDTLPRL